MRFLDLDFFLNVNAYCSGSDGGRLSSEYKPWSASKVRSFLEERRDLSHDTPVPGRIIESRDRVIDFWRTFMSAPTLALLLRNTGNRWKHIVYCWKSL
jgi:hypothetical protein